MLFQSANENLMDIPASEFEAPIYRYPREDGELISLSLSCIQKAVHVCLMQISCAVYSQVLAMEIASSISVCITLR